MWRRTSLGVVTSLALVLAACGGGSPTPVGTEGGEASEAPAVDQVLRVYGAAEDPPSIDPTLEGDTASNQVVAATQRPLLWWTQDLELTAEGGLATDLPEISEDGLTYTYTLRDGIAFSDGTPITAADFVYTWRRAVDPRTLTAAGDPVSYSFVFEPIAGAAEVFDLAAEEKPKDADIDAALENFAVKAVDDQTLELTLAEANYTFVNITALWVTSPVKQDWIESGDDYLEQGNYVSSGPFMLDTWEHDTEIVLVPNPEWYGDPPGLDELHIVYGSDPDGAFRAYQADELDIASVPTANAEQVRNDPVLSEEAVTGSVLCTYYLGFGALGGDTDLAVENIHLRKAISQAIDRETLVATVSAGIPTAADSFIPPGMPGHHDFGEGLPFDVDAAKAELQTALDELGLDKPSDISLDLGFNTGSGHEPIMEFVQAQLKDNLGIKVATAGEEWEQWLSTLAKSPPELPDLFRLGWCTDYPHPNNWLYDVFSCLTARAGYCNEDMDDLLVKAQHTPTLEEQLPIYDQANQMLNDDAPAAWLYWYGRFTLVKPKVTGAIATSGDASYGSYFYDKITISDVE